MIQGHKYQISIPGSKPISVEKLSRPSEQCKLGVDFVDEHWKLSNDFVDKYCKLFVDFVDEHWKLSNAFVDKYCKLFVDLVDEQFKLSNNFVDKYCKLFVDFKPRFAGKKVILHHRSDGF